MNRRGNRPSRARKNVGSNIRSLGFSARSGSASRVQQYVERMRATGAPGFRRAKGQAGMTRRRFLGTAAGIAGAGVAGAIGMSRVAKAQTPPSNVWHVSNYGDDANPGTGSQPFATIQHAIEVANPGDKIMVAPGEYAGAEVYKAVELVGSDDTKIISGTPNTYSPYFGVYAAFSLTPEGSGATIENFTIDCYWNPNTGENLLFGVFNAMNLEDYYPPAAADDVIVRKMKITNTMTGIYNWGGNGWTITHNEIYGLNPAFWAHAGGIVLMGDFRSANNNLISFNKIEAHVLDAETVGINIYTGALSGGFGIPCPIEWNQIVNNKVVITGTAPTVISGIAILDIGATIYGLEVAIKHNSIGFNDLRGCVTPEITLWPPEGLLDYDNVLSRNLGTGGIYDGLGPNRAYDGVKPTRFMRKIMDTLASQMPSQ